MTVDHSGRTHSLYSASSSERWMNCAASIPRSAGVPEGVSSSYALDGEEAHELLEYALVNGYNSAQEAFIMGEFHWTHRHDTEDERIASVQLAMDTAQDIIDAFGPNVQVFLEVRFHFPTEQDVDAGGTSDISIYVPDFDILHVVDFKHGAGHAVEVTENSQLLFYATGVRAELRTRGLCNSGRTAYILTIVQPRAFHSKGAVREFMCDDARLDSFIGEVNVAIRKTQAQTPEVKPGPWCKWCPAFTACQEAAQHRLGNVFDGYVSIDQARAQGLPDAAVLDVEKLAQIMEAAPAIREYLSAVEQQCIALARQGYNIPRHKLVYSQARRKWSGDERTIAVQLGHITGMDPNAFMPPSLITITDAEKQIREAIYKRVGKGKEARKLVKEANEAMAALTIKDTSGNLTLTDMDDKRPEVNLANQIPYVPVE